jgi:hypothetical protein
VIAIGEKHTQAGTQPGGGREYNNIESEKKNVKGNWQLERPIGRGQGGKLKHLI